jgi:hypothetical protein
MKKHIDWNAHIEHQEAEKKRDGLKTKIRDRKEYKASNSSSTSVTPSKENGRVSLGDGGFEVRPTIPRY